MGAAELDVSRNRTEVSVSSLTMLLNSLCSQKHAFSSNVRLFPSDLVTLFFPPISATFSNQYLPFPVLFCASASADLASSSESCLLASLEPEAVGFLVESTGPEASHWVRAAWVGFLCQSSCYLRVSTRPVLFVTLGNYSAGVSTTCLARP